VIALAAGETAVTIVETIVAAHLIVGETAVMTPPETAIGVEDAQIRPRAQGPDSVVTAGSQGEGEAALGRMMCLRLTIIAVGVMIAIDAMTGTVVTTVAAAAPAIEMMRRG